MFALEHKSEQMTELFLQKGIDVSVTDYFGQMALAYASASGHSG